MEHQDRVNRHHQRGPTSAADWKPHSTRGGVHGHDRGQCEKKSDQLHCREPVCEGITSHSGCVNGPKRPHVYEVTRRVWIEVRDVEPVHPVGEVHRVRVESDRLCANPPGEREHQESDAQQRAVKLRSIPHRRSNRSALRPSSRSKRQSSGFQPMGPRLFSTSDAPAVDCPPCWGQPRALGS